MSSKDYFNKVAKDWDEMTSSFFPDSVGEKAVQRADVKKGEWAVDIGAGTGFLSQFLLEKGLKVIAVDESEQMIELTKSRFDGDVDARVGHAGNLPVQTNSVDYAFANMYLHHVENPEAAIKEMVRILKPGGKVIITDLDEHNHEFLRTEQNDRWLGFKRTDINYWFEKSGLKNIVVDCVNEDCCADSETTSDKAKISIFIAYGENQC